MKNFIKTAILFISIPLSLTACSDLKEHVYCVETSDSLDYKQGECYQVNRKDVIETVYLISVPTNPEADPEDYEYDFTWNQEQKNSYFVFTDGLVGKKMIGVLLIDEYTLKINFCGMSREPEATHGFIKIFHYAYKSYTKRMQDTLLYAYFAIGDTSGMAVKPALPLEE